MCTLDEDEDGERRVVVLLALDRAVSAAAGAVDDEIIVHSGSGMVGRKGRASREVKLEAEELVCDTGESRMRPETSGPNWKDSASAVETMRSGWVLEEWERAL